MTAAIESAPEPRVASAVVRGTLSFAAVSVAGFAVWAFGGRWFSTHGGDPALYATSAVVFLGLSGLLMHGLVDGPHPLIRYYKVFVPAFLAYAIVWCACWFAWRFGTGEWLASFFGSAAFALVLAVAFRHFRPVVVVMLVLFATHSAGYFAGDALYKFTRANAQELLGVTRSTAGLLAKLLWGVCYGLGFGAGIGFAFHAFRTPRRTSGL